MTYVLNATQDSLGPPHPGHPSSHSHIGTAVPNWGSKPNVEYEENKMNRTRNIKIDGTSRRNRRGKIRINRRNRSQGKHYEREDLCTLFWTTKWIIPFNILLPPVSPILYLVLLARQPLTNGIDTLYGIGWNYRLFSVDGYYMELYGIMWNYMELFGICGDSINGPREYRDTRPIKAYWLRPAPPTRSLLL